MPSKEDQVGGRWAHKAYLPQADLSLRAMATLADCAKGSVVLIPDAEEGEEWLEEGCVVWVPGAHATVERVLEFADDMVPLMEAVVVKSFA
jgi:hypothetical protein